MMRYDDNTSHATCADVDPALERQLALAADGDLIEAVLVLQDSTVAQFMANAYALLARVCGREPAGAVEANYLPRLGVLVVRARPSIIRWLIAQPEVEVASANRVGGDNLCSSASC